MTKRESLHQYAVQCVGKNMSYAAPDELGCADSINQIALRALGKPIGGGASTNLMYQALKRGLWFFGGWRFVKVPMERALPGDVVISPTGYGNGKLSNGHVGILTHGARIISNNSNTGLMDTHLSVASWVERYAKVGGYPVEFYRVIR